MTERPVTVRVVQPAHFAKPRGYANGTVAEGRLVSVAGQIGWDSEGKLVSSEFVAQFAKALDNVLDVVRAAGGEPEHVANMTVFVTDLDAYRAGAAALGAVWRARLGRHYPAMALVGVAGLLEPGALVEIAATAALPPDAPVRSI